MMERIIELQRVHYPDWKMNRLKQSYNLGLRGVILNSMGTDFFPVKGARRIGLIVKSLPDYCSEELSDHAFKLMGTLIKQTNFDLPHPVTVLIVGSEGNVGKKIVQKCKEREFTVLEHDTIWSHTKKDLERDCKKSDVIFVCIPLNKESSRMFNSRLFTKLKDRKPLFINVSGRMKLFSKMDLFSALKQNWISGYACDENVYDRRLYRHEKMFFTPHVGWKSDESIRKRDVFLENLWREVKGNLK